MRTRLTTVAYVLCAALFISTAPSFSRADAAPSPAPPGAGESKSENAEMAKADLLVLSAHPDDELLFFGGTVPYYAGERRLAVQVAYLTHTADDERGREAAAGLNVCKLSRAPVFLAFRDSYSESLDTAARQLGREAVTEALVTLLRRCRPEVVVTHDLGGEYGHGAHMLCAACMRDAVAAAADPAAYPASAAAYGVWQTAKLYLHLYAENPIVLDLRQPLDAFGGQTALDIAKEAFRCHLSQQGYGFAVSDEGRYSAAKFGLAFSTVGADTAGNDFFEHIPPSSLTSFVSPSPTAPLSPTPTPSPLPSPSPASAAPVPAAAPAATDAPVAGIALPIVGSLAAIAVAAAWILLHRRKRKR